MQIEGINNIVKVQFLMVAAAVFISLICLWNGPEELLWMLPLLYAVCFLVFMVGKWYFTKMTILIINGCCFVRYVCLPFAYYYMNTGNLKMFRDKLFYNGSVIMIMFCEMSAIFFTISSYADRLYTGEKAAAQMELDNKIAGGSAFCILMAGILLVMRKPNLIHIRILLHGSIVESSVMADFIYNSASVILVLWLILRIKKTRYLHSDNLKCMLSFLIWCVFALDASINTIGNIGRWGLVIRLCVGLFLFRELYREQFWSLVILAGIFVGISVFCLTIRKFEQSMGDMDFLSSLKWIFNYKALNAYCDGPTNIAYAVKMKAESGSSYSVLTLVNDIFGNFPVVNHFFSADNRSPIYFNLAIYESGIAKDQICPLSGQAYGALYYPGIFLINGIVTYTAMKLDSTGEREHEILKRYIFKYLAVVWGLSTFLNLNIIFQMLWINTLPLILIQCFNYKIRIKKCCHKKPPEAVRNFL